MNRKITAIFLILVIASIWVAPLKYGLFLYGIVMFYGAAVSVYCRALCDEEASLGIALVKYIFKAVYLALDCFLCWLDWEGSRTYIIYGVLISLLLVDIFLLREKTSLFKIKGFLTNISDAEKEKIKVRKKYCIGCGVVTFVFLLLTNMLRGRFDLPLWMILLFALAFYVALRYCLEKLAEGIEIKGKLKQVSEFFSPLGLLVLWLGKEADKVAFIDETGLGSVISMVGISFALCAYMFSLAVWNCTKEEEE